MKRALALLLGATTIGCTLIGAGCGPQIVEQIDKNKTALIIANYNGGVGETWLDEMVIRFEKAYENVSLEDGKLGIDVVVDHSKDYSGKEIVSTMRADRKNHLFFTQAMDYYTMVNEGFMADITDVVTETVGSDSKKIESKLSSDKQDFLKKDGKYYAIPHYELYNGIQYDAGVFASKKLYFSDNFNQDGTRAFILNANTKKSCGPDGKYNTYDDGLPSSYEEFYRLIGQMKTNNVIPFIWTGKSMHYTNMLLTALFDNYIGAEGYETLLLHPNSPLWY